MARLNNRPARSPTRESSIYRDPTPTISSRQSRSGAYSGIPPSPGGSSDKENRTILQGRTASKSKDEMSRPDSLPTPNSDTNTPRANKRRRLGERDTPNLSRQATPESIDEEDVFDLQYYNPDQNEDVRREVRQGLRKNHREFRENRDEYLKPDNEELSEVLDRQNRLMSKVRQTTDATLDSRFLIDFGDIALKRVNAGTDTTAGVDINEFVSKCITFMRLGGPSRTAQDRDEPPRPTQSRRNRQDTRNAEGDEDEEDVDDTLDWELFGEKVCIPSTRRPPVPSFLLGPLSVQKRIRQTQARAPRQRRETQGPVTKPQELRAEDLQKAENSNLTTLVRGIRDRLIKVLEEKSAAVNEEALAFEDLPEEEQDEKLDELLAKHKVTRDYGINYFDFVINPHSFGQTIENIFYVSFAIKESEAKIELDENDLPILFPAEKRSIAEQREQNVSKHQAIFSLDYDTWHKLIQAFDIKEPLIPHRNDEEGQNVTAHGWYG